MFQLKPVNSIKCTVKVSVPGDYGKSTRADFDVEFKKLPLSEVKSLMESATNGDMKDFDVLADNIINIKGLKSEQGDDLEYSHDVLQAMLELEYVKTPLVDKFKEVQLGQESLRRKN